MSWKCCTPYNMRPFTLPVLLAKKDGSCQFCVDYRHLNDITAKNLFLLPIAEELAGVAYFLNLDLRANYHQICMREADEEKTTFRTHHDHFHLHYVVRPEEHANQLSVSHERHLHRWCASVRLPSLTTSWFIAQH